MIANHAGQRLVWTIMLFVVNLLPGCSNSPQCIPVQGTVTVDGAKVPGPGFIYFTSDPDHTQGLSRPGTAEFDAEGNYKVKTFMPGDGLLPGKYLLRVDCWQSAPNMEGKPVISFLPQKYQNASSSGLVLNVEPNSVSITFDVKLMSK